MIPLLDKNKIAELEYDIVIVVGRNIEMIDVLKQAKSFGLDEDKVVLDRTVMVPGFSLERYKILRHSQLSILSLVCWGGLIYHLFGLQFLSPTINMFFPQLEFLKFLRDPHHYLEQDLVFCGMDPKNHRYPIFSCDDIKLHMSHYRDADKARSDWETRRGRINWDNVLAMMFTRDPKVLAQFEQLPYKKKVCFVNFETDLSSGFYIAPKFYTAKVLWTIANDTARNKCQCFDMWDMLLYGKKTPINT